MYFDNIVKRESTKKLQLKNATHCHIYRNKIQVFCSKSDNNGIKTEWIEESINNMSHYLQFNPNTKEKYEYLFLDRDYVGFIKDITKIEFYPENNSGQTRDLGINRSTVILHMKKGIIREDSYLIDGVNIEGMGMKFMSLNDNEFFGKKNI